MAEISDVYFVDGVRTPFGRAGEKGMYWNTRADDMVVKAMIGLMERNPDVPGARVDDVAIAATTQEGDQGLTLGRTAAILAGLPQSVPGFAIDRMCAGAMTSVTTMAGSIGIGMYDVALAGGVEHMGRHPLGGDADPNPRFLTEKLVSADALNMGITAERIHDRFPHLTKERADRFGMLSQHKVQAAYDNGKIQPDLVPVAIKDADGAWGLATEDQGRRPQTTMEDLAALKTPFRAARPCHGRHIVAPDRRRDDQPAGRRRRGQGARAQAQDEARLLRLRRRPAGDHGHRPGALDREGPQEGRAHDR